MDGGWMTDDVERPGALRQVQRAGQRHDRVGHRAPHATQWSLLGSDEAIDMVVDRILTTRDRTWQDVDERGRPLQRTTGISLVAGASLTDEAASLATRLAWSLGVPDPVLTPDPADASAVLIVGCDMALTHPAQFERVLEAKRRGAVLMQVDPRFTRTSTHMDVFAQIRRGTDSTFLGGLIRHVLQHGMFSRDFLLANTNAAAVVRQEHMHHEALGLQSPVLSVADPASWLYEPAGADQAGAVLRDPSMTHPDCVLQLLKRRYARFTPAEVELVCGVPHEVFADIAGTFAATNLSGRGSTICTPTAGPGAAQGVVLQKLLGMAGRPGGGVLALSAEGPGAGRAGPKGGVEGALVLGSGQHSWPDSDPGWYERYGDLRWLVVRGPSPTAPAQPIATEVFHIPGGAHTDVRWITELGSRIKSRLGNGTDPRDDPVRALVWECPAASTLA
jgi:formate dehydrogenase major subunit